MRATTTEGLLRVLATWARDTGAVDALAEGSAHPPVLRIITATTPDAPVAPEDGGTGTLDTLRTLAGLAGADVAELRETVTEMTDPDHRRTEDERPVGLSAPQVAAGLDAGVALADAAVDAGERLILLCVRDSTVEGLTGIAASAITGTVCRREPVAVVGQGTSIDVADVDRWRKDVTMVRDAMFLARGYRNGPWDSGSVREVLRILGTTELAVTVGFLTGAAARHTPVILDGAASLSAALLAEATTPAASDWWLVPHLPAEPSARFAVERLGLTPVFQRSLGVADGGAGLVVVPLLKAAVATASGPR